MKEIDPLSNKFENMDTATVLFVPYSNILIADFFSFPLTGSIYLGSECTIIYFFGR